MYIRKSKIDKVIEKSISFAEKAKDSYWSKELDRVVTEIKSDHFLAMQEKEILIKELRRNIKNLERKLKRYHGKYETGRLLMSSAKHMVITLQDEYKDTLEEVAARYKNVAALKDVIERDFDPLLLEGNEKNLFEDYDETKTDGI